MGREVIAQTDVTKQREAAVAAAEPTTTADTYADRLIKYIPAEVVTLYFTLDALLPEGREILAWIVFLVLVVLTPIYLMRVQKVSKRMQLVISTVAFIVWVFRLGGPFDGLSWYDPLYGALLLPLYTFGIAIYEA